MKRFIFVAAFGFLSVSLALVISGLLQNSHAGGKKYINPLPRKNEILKLFSEEFISITPGKGPFSKSFLMGSMSGPTTERPVRKVTFNYSFAMAQYEVTQELYHVVMGNNPSKWKGLRNSVEMHTWGDSVEFCRKATKLLRDGKFITAKEEIRLPTEAEWEYAYRAGTSSAYPFGDDPAYLRHYAWYKANSKGYDPPGGVKRPNRWGLSDMPGYIWEWCQDDWAPNYKEAPTDGSARVISGAKEKVMRGGSWAAGANECRSAFRGHAAAGARSDKIGFRCVLAKVKK